MQSKKSKANAILLFRREFIAAEKARGLKRKWLTADAWKDVKAAFNNLQPDERQHWKQQAVNLNFSNRFARQQSGRQGTASIVPAQSIGDSDGSAVPVESQDAAAPHAVARLANGQCLVARSTLVKTLVTLALTFTTAVIVGSFVIESLIESI